MKQLKPLLPLGDATVADVAIGAFSSIGVDVFLVVGYCREKIESGVKQQGMTIVYNPDYETGMLSSVQAGIRHLGKQYRAFFMLPVDIPLVSAATLRQLIKAGAEHPGKIVYPVFDGRRGHPPLIPAALIPGILEWKQEGGLKTFLKLHEGSALNVPVNDGMILFDIDTPEDYRELQRRYRALH